MYKRSKREQILYNAEYKAWRDAIILGVTVFVIVVIIFIIL